MLNLAQLHAIVRVHVLLANRCQCKDSAALEAESLSPSEYRALIQWQHLATRSDGTNLLHLSASSDEWTNPTFDRR